MSWNKVATRAIGPLLVTLGAVLGLAACEDAADDGAPQTTADSAAQDGGTTDTGAPDAGAGDVGPGDVGPGDAGASDTPEGPDTADTSTAPDAADTATPDTAGADADAGPPDPDSCVVKGCDTGDDTTCRKAACVAETGTCIMNWEPDGKPCNDGDPETADDACKSGECKGVATVCVCTVNQDCKSYDDDNKCNGTYVCNGCKCVVDPATVIACDTSGDDQCNATVCKPATGACELTPVLAGTACDDGDACSKNDKCKGGQCVGTILPDACANDADCASFDDGNPCNGVFTCQLDGLGCGHCLWAPDTVVTCDATGLPECQKMECNPTSGQCEQLPVFSGALCSLEDGGSGVCAGGACYPKAPPCVCDFGPGACDDGDPCTTDSCDGCACQHAKQPGCCVSDAACDDGDPCTADACTESGCTNTSYVCTLTAPGCPGATDGDLLCCDTVAQCNDGSPLTADLCVDNRCANEPLACTCAADGDCDDGDACTTDTCDGCTCTKAPIDGCCVTAADCDDGDPCTADTCAPEGTCAHEDSGVPQCCATAADCSPGLVCYQDGCAVKPKCTDACETALDCDDGDPWSIDSCAPGAQGCGVCHHTK